MNDVITTMKLKTSKVKDLVKNLKSMKGGEEYHLIVKEMPYGTEKYFFKKEENNIIARKVRGDETILENSYELSDYLRNIKKEEKLN